jgi:tetratricopeptide (TPR) repeat protein
VLSDLPITIFSWEFFVPALVMALLLASAWMSRKRFPFVTFGVTWFLVFLAMSYGNVQRGDDFRTVYNGSDRYAYLASVGIFFVIASGCHLLMEHRKNQQTRIASTVILSAIMLILAGRSFVHAQTFESSIAVFQNVLRHYPDSHEAHLNVGVWQLQQGNLSAAMREYEKSIALLPTFRGFLNLAEARELMGDTSGALKQYRLAREINPWHAPTQLKIGIMLASIGNFREAIKELELASTLDPLSALPYFYIAHAYAQDGKRDLALVAMEEAHRLAPDDKKITEQLEMLRKEF